MPIDYEPSQPLNPAISQEYGAATQFTHDLPSLTQLAIAQRHMQQQSAEGYRQSELAQAGLAQRAAQFGGQQQQHQQDIAARMTALGQQDEHQKLQLWQRQQEMTFPEQQRLMQQKAAVAEVMNNPELDDATKNDLVLKLKTGIDVGEQRIHDQQQKQMQMKTDLLKQEMIRQKEAELTNQESEKQMKAAGIGVLPIVDPETGRRHILLQHPKTGEWYNPIAGGGAKQGDDNAFKGHESALKEWHAAYDSALKTVQAWADAHTKDPIEGDKPINPQYRNAETFRAAVNREMKFRLGLKKEDVDNEKVLAPTPDEWITKRTGKGGAPTPATPGTVAPGAAPAGAASAAGDVTPGGGPAGAPTTQQPPPAPFGTDPATWTPQQKSLVSDWGELRQLAHNVNGLTPDERRSYLNHQAWALTALRTFGSESRMPPDVRERYVAILNAFSGLKAPAPAAPVTPLDRSFGIASGRNK